MTDVEKHGQDFSEKSDSLMKDSSSNIVRKFNTIVIKTPNNESQKPSMKKKKQSNFNKRNNINRIIITFFFGLIVGTLLFYFGLPILYAIISSLYTTTSSYNEEVKFTIDINNNSIKETKYQRILLDSFDVYIEQETYDHKIVPLKKESDLLGKNASFGNVQVSLLIFL